jgi:hypothetical protein
LWLLGELKALHAIIEQVDVKFVRLEAALTELSGEMTELSGEIAQLSGAVDTLLELRVEVAVLRELVERAPGDG